MQIRSLNHLIGIVKAMARPRMITVLGSSSLLAGIPDLGEKGRPLEMSFDADLLVDPCDERQAEVLHEAIGEGSLFHKEYGVFADLVKPGIVETFPDGWQKRCLFLQGDKSVQCLHPIDLAVIKLVLGREKDISLLKALIKTEIISLAALQEAYQRTAMNEREMFKAGRILRQLELAFDDGYATSSDIPPLVREAKIRYKVARKRQQKARR